MLINWLTLQSVTWQVINYSLIIKYLLRTWQTMVCLILLKLHRFNISKLLTQKISTYYINDNNNDNFEVIIKLLIQVLSYNTHIKIWEYYVQIANFAKQLGSLGLLWLCIFQENFFRYGFLMFLWVFRSNS